MISCVDLKQLVNTILENSPLGSPNVYPCPSSVNLRAAAGFQWRLALAIAIGIKVRDSIGMKVGASSADHNCEKVGACGESGASHLKEFSKKGAIVQSQRQRVAIGAGMQSSCQLLNRRSDTLMCLPEKLGQDRSHAFFACSLAHLSVSVGQKLKLLNCSFTAPKKPMPCRRRTMQFFYNDRGLLPRQ